MPDTSSHDDLITYAQAVETFGVSLRTLHRLREDGQVTVVVRHTVRGGRRVFLHRSEIDALMAAASKPGR